VWPQHLGIRVSTPCNATLRTAGGGVHNVNFDVRGDTFN